MGEFGIYIDSEPVSKLRSRSTKSGRHYTPAKTVEAESRIAKQFREEWNNYANGPIKGPIRLACEFHMTIPKSASKKKQSSLAGKPCLKAPDTTNLLKLVEDAINHTGVWVDDCQVFHVTGEKYWSACPHTSITIFWDDDLND